MKYLELIFVSSSIVWSRSFLTLVVSCWNLWYYSKKSCRFSRWLIIIIQTELKVFHTGPGLDMLETQWQMLFSSNRFQIVGTIVKNGETLDLATLPPLSPYWLICLYFQNVKPTLRAMLAMFKHIQHPALVIICFNVSRLPKTVWGTRRQCNNDRL